jgi:small subunit ribosomal protein S13|tara:strand:+ start:180 stop:572 length:393 start_codon:yes stop_codon:yes gene_type:complete
MNIQLGDIQLKKAYTKPLYRALSEIFGIGSANASSFCKELGLSKSERLGSLSKYKQQVVLQMFSDYLTDNNIMIDSELSSVKKQDLARLRSIQSYRGIRNFQGLPVRGQRTETNGSTKKRRSAYAGGPNQ